MLKKEDVTHYWQEDGSTFKAKIFVSEHKDEVIARVRWKDGDTQRQAIITIHPIATCREMAQRAIDIIKEKLTPRAVVKPF